MSCCTGTGLVHLCSKPLIYVTINANIIGLLKESHRTLDWLYKM